MGSLRGTRTSRSAIKNAAGLEARVPRAAPEPGLQGAFGGPPRNASTQVLALCFAGDPAAAGKALAPFKAIGKPIADVVGPVPYAGWQTAFDPLLAPGERN